MKIKRFNESVKNNNYLLVSDIRDLFLYWIEGYQTELDLVILEMYSIEADGDVECLLDITTSYEGTSVDEYGVDTEISGIICCNVSIPYRFTGTDGRFLNSTNLKKVSDFICRMMDSVQSDLNEKHYIIALNSLYDRNGDLQLIIQKKG